MIVDEDIYRDGRWVLRWRDPILGFVQTRLGGLHNNMTQRGRPGGSYQGKFAPYDGVTVAPEWLGYGTGDQAFCDWAVRQPGWGKGWHLDKDLLVPGNRIYGPQTCCFIPREVNSAIIPRKMPKSLIKQAKDGSWTLRFDQCLKKIKVTSLPTREAAIEAWKTHRREYVQLLAEQHKSDLDPRAYQALLNWQP